MANALLRPPVFYRTALVLWIVWLTGVFNFEFVALAVYLVFVGLILWSAVRHRQRGWFWGLLFGLLLLTLPVWVGVAFELFKLLVK